MTCGWVSSAGAATLHLQGDHVTNIARQLSDSVLKQAQLGQLRHLHEPRGQHSEVVLLEPQLSQALQPVYLLRNLPAAARQARPATAGRSRQSHLREVQLICVLRRCKHCG